MKCIVIDDEPLARQGIQMLVDELPTIEVLKDFSTPNEAGDFLQKNKIDLVFLDVEVLKISGIDFLKSVSQTPMVIFTTAYPQYALEGFELDVVDYLVKPIRYERFFKAITKAQAIKNAMEGVNAANDYTMSDDDHVFVRADRKYVKLYIKDIDTIEGLKDYSIIHSNGEKTITAMNLKTIEGQLPQDIFIRVNKSYIINKNHITQVESDNIHIGTKQVPIGERYRQEFFDRVIKDKWIKR